MVRGGHRSDTAVDGNIPRLDSLPHCPKLCRHHVRLVRYAQAGLIRDSEWVWGSHAITIPTFFMSRQW